MTNASKLADKYFADQCKRLGEIERDHGCEGELVSRKLLRKMTDKDLYNQAADLIVNEMLADAAVQAAGKKRKPPQHVQNRMSATDLAKFVQAHEASHQRVLKDNPLYAQARQNELDHERMGALIAKDHRDGLAIEDAIARGDLKPRSLEDIYAVLKGEK